MQQLSFPFSISVSAKLIPHDNRETKKWNPTKTENSMCCYFPSPFACLPLRFWPLSSPLPKNILFPSAARQLNQATKSGASRQSWDICSPSFHFFGWKSEKHLLCKFSRWVENGGRSGRRALAGVAGRSQHDFRSLTGLMLLGHREKSSTKVMSKTNLENAETLLD